MNLFVELTYLEEGGGVTYRDMSYVKSFIVNIEDYIHLHELITMCQLQSYPVQDCRKH